MSGKLEPTNSPYAMAKLASIEIADSMKKNLVLTSLILCQQIFMAPMIIFQLRVVM